MLSAFPAASTADPEQALRNFIEVAEDFDADLVEDAVTLFIKGQVPGFDGRFAPTAPMLAGACRLAAEHRARRKFLEGLAAPRLPSPTIEKTDEQRARARAQMQQAIDNLAAATALETVEVAAANKARWDKTNERFHPDMSDEAVMDRLIHKRPAFTAGDPDGDRDVA